ncbi:MAG TPA: hypothetical protein VHL09_02800 [Dehalococcoidia bacterium]|nr:hypothetical protein [Dehalococcoidia bacterium]
MLLVALVAFLALVVAWFLLPGETTPVLTVESPPAEPIGTLAAAEA